MRPQKGRGIVISGGIVEVAELRRGTNPQSIARALLCCLSVNSASLGPDRLCCCLLNSLDGVRGCLVSGIQPPRRDGVVSCPAERSSARCSDTPVRYFKNTSMEDGRPRPSRFEHSRASQIPFSPPRTT